MYSGVESEHEAAFIGRLYCVTVIETEIPGADLMKRFFAVLCAAFVVAVLSAAAGAQTLRVGVDKASILRLDTDAATIMIANPAIADVAVENSRLIFVLGRTTGETNLFILDNRGREIMTAAIVVVPNLDRQVTVHRSLVEATLSCDPRCASIPNPGRGPVATGGGGGLTEEDEGAGSTPDTSAGDIAAAAAAAAAAAVAGQSGGQQDSPD